MIKFTWWRFRLNFGLVGSDGRTLLGLVRCLGRTALRFGVGLFRRVLYGMSRVVRSILCVCARRMHILTGRLRSKGRRHYKERCHSHGCQCST